MSHQLLFSGEEIEKKVRRRRRLGEGVGKGMKKEKVRSSRRIRSGEREA